MKDRIEISVDSETARVIERITDAFRDEFEGLDDIKNSLDSISNQPDITIPLNKKLSAVEELVHGTGRDLESITKLVFQLSQENKALLNESKQSIEEAELRGTNVLKQFIQKWVDEARVSDDKLDTLVGWSTKENSALSGISEVQLQIDEKIVTLGELLEQLKEIHVNSELAVKNSFSKVLLQQKKALVASKAYRSQYRQDVKDIYTRQNKRDEQLSLVIDGKEEFVTAAANNQRDTLDRIDSNRKLILVITNEMSKIETKLNDDTEVINKGQDSIIQEQKAIRDQIGALEKAVIEVNSILLCINQPWWKKIFRRNQ